MDSGVSYHTSYYYISGIHVFNKSLDCLFVLLSLSLSP